MAAADSDSSDYDSSDYEMPEDRILNPVGPRIEDRARAWQCFICEKQPPLDDVESLDYRKQFSDHVLSDSRVQWIRCTSCKRPYHYDCLKELTKQSGSKSTVKQPTFVCQNCGRALRILLVEPPNEAPVEAPLRQFGLPGWQRS